MSTVTLLNRSRSDLWSPCRGRLVSKKDSFIADQRGAVAVETLLIYLIVVTILLVPLADVAIAGFQYLSAWQALRGFGQSIQYAPPPDVTNVSSGWTSSTLAKAATAGLQNFGIQILCVDPNNNNIIVCSTTNTAPKYYLYTTTVTFAPIVLRNVLCTRGNANPCTYTLSYSERFQ